MNIHQTRILKSIYIIKPNFHAFTARLHSKLEQAQLTMSYTNIEQFNEKSYTFYCVLERIIKNLHNPNTLAPFLAHHIQSLKQHNVAASDIDVLCDSFLQTLSEHLGTKFDEQTQQAWQYALNYFTNFTNNQLFNCSNVVSLQQKLAQKQNSQ